MKRYDRIWVLDGDHYVEARVTDVGRHVITARVRHSGEVYHLIRSDGGREWKPWI